MKLRAGDGKLHNYTTTQLHNCTTALAQVPAFVRDRDAAGRSTLSKEELGQALTGASMSRINARGSSHNWKNNADGTFIISSDNQDRGEKTSTARGNWNISDDGRCCVLIEWKGVETEEWCRYIIRAGGEYDGAKSGKTGSEKVYKFEISKQ